MESKPIKRKSKPQKSDLLKKIKTDKTDHKWNKLMDLINKCNALENELIAKGLIKKDY